MRRLLIILALCLGFHLGAAEVIPPAPKLYFNDYANVVSTATANQLNETLAGFERESSEQILVAIFPKLQSDSAIEDYTVRVARAWKVGQKNLNNGAVLFVFVQDHKMYLQVGYGLESVLPDALCKRIIAEQITPRFKSGDFNGGLIAGVQSILAAAKGEYKGTGSTVAENRRNATGGVSVGFIIIIVVVILIVLSSRRRFGSGGSGWIFTGGGGGWSGGGGGGWSSGGGGGGFSGGGGSFGGGGAGGSW